MFTCIACTKQTDDGGEDGAARGSGTPSTKEAVKSLTTQIKDMALKFSGAYRQCKPCTGSSSYKKGQRPYPDFDTASEGVPYPYIGGASASSTPAWDFPPINRHPHTRSDSRFKAAYRGDQTPGGDSTISACDVVLEDEDEPKEWMAQVEPGVHITFVSSKVGRDSPMTSANKDWTPRNYKPSGSKGFPSDQHYDHGNSHPYAGSSAYPAGSVKGDMSSMEASRTTTSSRDEPSISISNASDIEAEWVEEDEPGVYITIRQLVDGTRELRRVRFSRERFGEMNAKQWWEHNRERIQAQYL